MLADFYSIIITKNNPNNYQDRCQDVVNQIKLLKVNFYMNNLNDYIKN